MCGFPSKSFSFISTHICAGENISLEDFEIFAGCETPEGGGVTSLSLALMKINDIFRASEHLARKVKLRLGKTARFEANLAEMPKGRL